MTLLSIKNLQVCFKQSQGKDLKAVQDFNLEIKEGERIGIVGESGAGKTIAAFSILNLLKKPGYIKSGEIYFQGKSLIDMPEKQLNQIRGNQLSMIFQDPMVTLNPILTIGEQLIETIRAHRKISKKQAKEESIKILKKVKIPSPEKRFNQYPFEFSGGMRQRVIIACAIINKPKLLIADEPTTALDVTIQAEIIELLYELSINEKISIILITHDLALVSQVAEKILVMYAGKIIETNTTKKILKQPLHPYTQSLLNCLPQKHQPGEKLYQIPGLMPSLIDVPETCAFYPRCNKRKAICQEKKLTTVKRKKGEVLCFLPNQ